MCLRERFWELTEPLLRRRRKRSFSALLLRRKNTAPRTAIS
jgi:hypothetical protein